MSAYESFKDYMYYLLHKPIKTNTLYKLFTVLGEDVDQIKTTIFEVRKQANILTATGKYLDLHGKDRDMFRYKNESDEIFRYRLIAKFEISKKAGTQRGIELVLNSMGYTDHIIKPLYQDDDNRWAEFQIDLNDNGNRVTLQDIDFVHNEVLKVKQASSKPNYIATNKLDNNSALNMGLMPSVKRNISVKNKSVNSDAESNIKYCTKIKVYRKIIVKEELN